MSEPLSGTATAAALGGATAFGLFTNTDFGIVFGAFAGALFVATMPQALSAWRVALIFWCHSSLVCWGQRRWRHILQRKQVMTVPLLKHCARYWYQWYL